MTAALAFYDLEEQLEAVCTSCEQRPAEEDDDRCVHCILNSDPYEFEVVDLEEASHV